MTRKLYRMSAVVAACCLAGGVASSLTGGASAHTSQTTTTSERQVIAADEGRDGLASMSSPFIPGVPHVPANVGIAVSPGGEARLIGPDGSMSHRVNNARPSDGLASMHAPYIAGVPHVPAGIGIAVSPTGDVRYLGPSGSIFDGPADEVEARVDAWWHERVAEGATPEEADRLLAELADR